MSLSYDEITPDMEVIVDSRSCFATVLRTFRSTSASDTTPAGTEYVEVKCDTGSIAFNFPHQLRAVPGPEDGQFVWVEKIVPGDILCGALVTKVRGTKSRSW